eukprot:snap_masked-scaffold_5-processed-gene-20.42-mRNA-1 protein AED:0.04 eAED:0.07 QI:0/-1/0/1/-1/1/1/0/347
MEEYQKEEIITVEDPFAGEATHNLQRKAAIVSGGAVNHGLNVMFKSTPNFDLNNTIFKTVSGKFGARRLIVKARLGNDEYWKNETKDDIEEKYEEYMQKMPVLKNPNHNQAILNFMKEDCNFLAEHADGSFMDHLYFCHDYSAVHYKEVSPRVLFLHSILGVGTNMFPMEVDKIPKLKGLLTDEEFKQTEAFPSVLRMIYHNRLLKELAEIEDWPQTLKKITFHRVIDNKKLELSKDEFIVAMNYQMVHQLDFLPCSNWCTQIKDPFFQVFIEIHDFLTKFGLLRAEMDQNLSSPSEKNEHGMPLTLGNFISGLVPKALKRNETASSMESNSSQIAHSLEYTLHWKE